MQAHINFVSWAPHVLLESIAAGMVKAATPTVVAKVFDQYLSFIALEDSLFTLALEDSYVQLNDNQASESQLEAAVAAVVEGLFSVCATLSVVPRIRCAPGGLAEHVSRALGGKIVEHLKGKGTGLFMGSVAAPSIGGRPLLCIFDRNFDLTPMVEHPFTYKALVHDCLGMHLNKVEITQAGAAGAPTKALSIEITEDDAFWQQNGHRQFGAVAEEMDIQVSSKSSLFGFCQLVSIFVLLNSKTILFTAVVRLQQLISHIPVSSNLSRNFLRENVYISSHVQLPACFSGVFMLLYQWACPIVSAVPSKASAQGLDPLDASALLCRQSTSKLLEGAYANRWDCPE